MREVVTSREGDTVDLIALRERGQTHEITERILDLNPGLAELGPVLPTGTLVSLPDHVPTKRVRNVPRIWS